MRIIRAALPYLRQSDGGRVVNIASTEGLGATKYASPYTAAKTGVIGLTRSLAVELGTENITVNCVCPGPIHTGMTESIPEDDKREYARRRVALKRYADPEEVAHATLSLVLPASTFITGVALLLVARELPLFKVHSPRCVGTDSGLPVHSHRYRAELLDGRRSGFAHRVAGARGRLRGELLQLDLARRPPGGT